MFQMDYIIPLKGKEGQVLGRNQSETSSPTTSCKGASITVKDKK